MISSCWYQKSKETHISTRIMTQFHNYSDVQKTHLTRIDSWGSKVKWQVPMCNNIWKPNENHHHHINLTNQICKCKWYLNDDWNAFLSNVHSFCWNWPNLVVANYNKTQEHVDRSDKLHCTWKMMVRTFSIWKTLLVNKKLIITCQETKTSRKLWSQIFFNKCHSLIIYFIRFLFVSNYWSL